MILLDARFIRIHSFGDSISLSTSLIRGIYLEHLEPLHLSRRRKPGTDSLRVTNFLLSTVTAQEVSQRSWKWHRVPDKITQTMNSCLGSLHFSSFYFILELDF